MPDNVLEIKVTGDTGTAGPGGQHPAGSGGGGSKQHTPGGAGSGSWQSTLAKALYEQNERDVKKRTDAEYAAYEKAQLKAQQAKEKEARRAASRVAEARGNVLTAGFGAQAITGSNGSAGAGLSGAVQMAGSGMFGARAAALAGGPVGAAVMIAGMAIDQHAAANERKAERIEWMGRAAGAAANSVFRGDAFGGARDFVVGARDKALQSVESIPIVGKYIASEIKVALAPLNAAAGFFEAAYGGAMTRAGELAPLSGRISAAQAQADVRSLMADIKEEQMLGGDYASLVDESSRFKETMNEIFLPLKAGVLSLLVDIVRDARSMAEGAKEFLSLVPALKKYFGSSSTEPLPAMKGLWAAMDEMTNRLVAQGQVGRLGDKQPVPAAPVAGPRINTVGQLNHR